MNSGTFVKRLLQNWSKTFFDNEKTFYWNLELSK